MFCFKMAMGCSSPAAATATKVSRITCVQKLCKLGIRFASAQRREPVKPISFFFSPASCARLSNPWAVGVECAFHESAGLFIYRPVGCTQVWPPFVCPPPCPGTGSERKNWQLFLVGTAFGPSTETSWHQGAHILFSRNTCGCHFSFQLASLNDSLTHLVVRYSVAARRLQPN